MINIDYSHGVGILVYSSNFPENLKNRLEKQQVRKKIINLIYSSNDDKKKTYMNNIFILDIRK